VVRPCNKIGWPSQDCSSEHTGGRRQHPRMNRGRLCINPSICPPETAWLGENYHKKHKWYSYDLRFRDDEEEDVCYIVNLQ